MIIATTNIDEDAGSHSYNFYVRDYLGSVRAVVGANGELWQFNDYHVTGIPSSQFGALNADDHLHTGKEYNAFNGLHMYDNNARTQDPILGRFTTTDPLAEKYPNFSPYAHCANNPILYVDPTGREWIWDTTINEEDREKIEDMISIANKNNLFATFFNSISESKVKYTISIGNTIKDKDGSNVPGQFSTENNTITFNSAQSATLSVITEEVYHAYQEDQSSVEKSEWNREYEAKIVTTEICKETGMVLFDSLGSLGSKIFFNNKPYLTPDKIKSKSFLKEYISTGESFINYYKKNNMGNDNYTTPINRIPLTLINAITKAYGK